MSRVLSTQAILTHCFRCEADYAPDAKWVYGWREPRSTTTEFHVTSHKRDGDCPICRQPPLLENPYVEARPM